MVNVSHQYSHSLFGIIRRIWDSRGKILGVQFLGSSGHFPNRYDSFLVYNKKGEKNKNKI